MTSKYIKTTHLPALKIVKEMITIKLGELLSQKKADSRIKKCHPIEAVIGDIIESRKTREKKLVDY